MHPILDKKAVFFDLDGTLVDSAKDIHHSLNYAMQHHGLSSVTLEHVRSWIGRGSKVLIELALRFHLENSTSTLSKLFFTNQSLIPSLPENSGIHLQNIKKNQPIETADDYIKLVLPIVHTTFLNHYQVNVCNHTTIYEGVIELLDALKAQGKTLVLITNKPEQPALKLLKTLNLFDYFQLILGGDSLAKRKPDPLPLNHSLTHFNLQPNEAVMVGDSKFDVLAGYNANMETIAVTYGYNHGEAVIDSKPTVVVDKFRELLL